MRDPDQDARARAHVQQIAPEPLEEAPRPRLKGEPAFRALRHRNFRLFAMGQMVSLTGTWMQTVAQAWLVYRLSHSEVLLGATYFCSQLPVFLLGPLGGLAADRYSRLRIVLITQTLAMVQALALATLAVTGSVKVWHVLALASLLGIINAFDMPARQSLLIHLSGRENLLNAISLNSTIFNLARLLGPLAAGGVVARYGEGACFLLNGASFLAVIACLMAVRLPHADLVRPESPLKHLIDGFRYANSNRPVRALLGMMAIVSVAAIPAQVLMPFFADAIFHRGAGGLGVLVGMMGAGAVIGTLVLARRTDTAGLPGVLFLSAFTLGAAFIAFALSPWFALSLAIMPVIGFSVMRQYAALNTLIQVLIPDAYRGRIMALYSMTVVGVGPFGSLASGVLASHIGVRATVVGAGFVLAAAAMTFRLRLARFPELNETNS